MKTRHFIYFNLLVLVLLVFSGISFANPLDLDTKVDKDTITIGDRIKYEVILEYDDGIEIEPLVVAANLGAFEIKDYSIEEPKKTKSGRWTSKTTYIITTFTTGEYVIPPIKIKYKDLDGNENEISSDQIKINVKSVEKLPGEGDDIRPLKETVDIRGGFNIWAIIILILLLAIGVVIFFYFKRKKNIQKTPSEPPRPAEEIAMEELKALLDMKLIEKGMVKEYYIRLSDIMRKYIEGRYKIFAMEETTWELYQEMRVKRIERKHVDKIRDFLEDCDLVKFAKYIPTKKEIGEVYGKAQEIIKLNSKSQIPNTK